MTGSMSRVSRKVFLSLWNTKPALKPDFLLKKVENGLISHFSPIWITVHGGVILGVSGGSGSVGGVLGGLNSENFYDFWGFDSPENLKIQKIKTALATLHSKDVLH